MEIGEYRLEVVRDTEFWLDGGAMFGVIPRVLWERVSPPDELNRIRLTMNCVFIDTGKDRILIETGIGEKWTEREIEMYGIKRERPFAESLKAISGCTPEDITIVVNTHLHFDHAGGNTSGGVEEKRSGGDSYPAGYPPSASDDGVVLSPAPQFPNARYLVSKSEMTHANDPHERDRASYLPVNWQPIERAGQLELMPDDYEVVPGLKMQTVRGHSETMQTWSLSAGGETVYGFADLIPTRHHLAPAWIMGYDLYPTETLAFKKHILPQAVTNNWLCLFYHDPETALARLTVESGKFIVSRS
jgi:glyoxylase-like metal-dependent hydrolase (beta-lactamase superfamily II)